MNLYSLRSTLTGFRVIKFDEDYNATATYEMAQVGSTWACTCPSITRRGPSCKHIDMAYTFVATDRIDTGWFYDRDSGRWYPPLVPVERMKTRPMDGRRI